jgi:hypothetical protein
LSHDRAWSLHLAGGGIVRPTRSHRGELPVVFAIIAVRRVLVPGGSVAGEAGPASGILIRGVGIRLVEDLINLVI